MPTIADVRLRNLYVLAEQYGSWKRLSELTGVAPSQFSHMKRRGTEPSSPGARGIGDNLARRLERALGLPYAWMDANHDDSQGHGLTMVQKTTLDTARRLARAQLLTDAACLDLLNAWLPLIERLKVAPEADRIEPGTSTQQLLNQE